MSYSEVQFQRALAEIAAGKRENDGGWGELARIDRESTRRQVQRDADVLQNEVARGADAQAKNIGFTSSIINYKNFSETRNSTYVLAVLSFFEIFGKTEERGTRLCKVRMNAFSWYGHQISPSACIDVNSLRLFNLDKFCQVRVPEDHHPVPPCLK